MDFLQQGMNTAVDLQASLHDLEVVMTQPTQQQQIINNQPAVTPGAASANAYKQQ